MIIGGFIAGPKIFPLRVIKYVYDYRRTPVPRKMTYPVQISVQKRNQIKFVAFKVCCGMKCTSALNKVTEEPKLLKY